MMSGISVASANLVVRCHSGPHVPLTPFLQTANWSVHRTIEGKTYFFNKITKQSTWQKPDALRTPEELSQPWREYSTATGRRYYYNVTTKENAWEMPEAFKQFLQKHGLRCAQCGRSPRADLVP